MTGPITFTVTLEVAEQVGHESASSIVIKEALTWIGKEAGQARFGWCAGIQLALAFSRLRLPFQEFREAAEAFDDRVREEEFAASNPTE